MSSWDDLEALRDLVRHGRFAGARAFVAERGEAVFVGLTREEFVALSDMLAVIDQATDTTEIDQPPDTPAVVTVGARH